MGMGMMVEGNEIGDGDMGINDYDDNDYDEITGDDTNKEQMILTNNRFSCFYMAFRHSVIL